MATGVAGSGAGWVAVALGARPRACAPGTRAAGRVRRASSAFGRSLGLGLGFVAGDGEEREVGQVAGQQVELRQGLVGAAVEHGVQGLVVEDGLERGGGGDDEVAGVELEAPQGRLEAAFARVAPGAFGDRLAAHEDAGAPHVDQAGAGLGQVDEVAADQRRP